VNINKTRDRQQPDMSTYEVVVKNTLIDIVCEEPFHIISKCDLMLCFVVDVVAGVVVVVVVVVAVVVVVVVFWPW